MQIAVLIHFANTVNSFEIAFTGNVNWINNWREWNALIPVAKPLPDKFNEPEFRACKKIRYFIIIYFIYILPVWSVPLTVVHHPLSCFAYGIPGLALDRAIVLPFYHDNEVFTGSRITRSTVQCTLLFLLPSSSTPNKAPPLAVPATTKTADTQTKIQKWATGKSEMAYSALWGDSTTSTVTRPSMHSG